MCIDEGTYSKSAAASPHVCAFSQTELNHWDILQCRKNCFLKLKTSLSLFELTYQRLKIHYYFQYYFDSLDIILYLFGILLFAYAVKKKIIISEITVKVLAPDMSTIYYKSTVFI